MTEVVDLWVCPNCHILHGIETKINKNKNQLTTNCVSCGTLLTPDEVGFLDQQLARAFHSRIETIFPDLLDDEIRCSWVSNKTVGIIFEVDREDIAEMIDGDIEDVIDNLESELGLSITTYYE